MSTDSVITAAALFVRVSWQDTPARPAGDSRNARNDKHSGPILPATTDREGYFQAAPRASGGACSGPHGTHVTCECVEKKSKSSPEQLSYLSLWQVEPRDRISTSPTVSQGSSINRLAVKRTVDVVGVGSVGTTWGSGFKRVRHVSAVTGPDVLRAARRVPPAFCFPIFLLCVPVRRSRKADTCCAACPLLLCVAVASRPPVGCGVATRRLGGGENCRDIRYSTAMPGGGLSCQHTEACRIARCQSRTTRAMRWHARWVSQQMTWNFRSVLLF